MDWTMPMDPDDLARLAKIRQQFSDCCTAIAEAGGNANAVSAALAKYLAVTSSVTLPPSAQVVWSERVARPMKADAAKILHPVAIAAIRSWPMSRVNDFVAALAEIEAILIDTENEALNVAIYVEISRAYS